MSNVIELKHGELNVKLLACTKAYTLMVSSLEADGITELTSDVNSVIMLHTYAYYAYKMWCRENGETPKHKEMAFIDLISDYNDKDGSNLKEVYEFLGDSIITTIQTLSGKDSEKKSNLTTN